MDKINDWKVDDNRKPTLLFSVVEITEGRLLINRKFGVFKLHFKEACDTAHSNQSHLRMQFHTYQIFRFFEYGNRFAQRYPVLCIEIDFI